MDDDELGAVNEQMLIDGVAVRAVRPLTTSRPPVLFVHGMFGGSWMWELWQRFLSARGYASYAINLRGHHGSRPVPSIGQVSVTDYIDDARAVARMLGRPIVVGHSMGGFIAQKLAESGDVLAAVLVAAAPPRWINPISLPLLRRMVFHLHDLAFSRPIVASRKDADALMFTHTPRSDADEQFPKLVPESGRAGRELALGTVAVDASKIRVPMLSVGAAEDRFVVPRIARALARKYRCELIIYPSRGHQLITEPGWELVAQAVIQWMERTILPGDDAA